jgi:hypothetical protein
MCGDIFEDFIPDWDDWGIIFPISEEMAEDEKNLKKIKKSFDDEDDDENEPLP